jgi:agmatinase
MTTPIVKKNYLGDQPDPTENPRYCGISTFCRLPYGSFGNIGIVGIPFDSGCTFRPGARFGPESIRKNSRLLRSYNTEQNIYPFKDRKVIDCGDLSVTPFNNSDAITCMHDNINQHFEKFNNLIFLGGDHTISYPILHSINKKFGKVSLIHFDSHLDTWDSYFGEKITHGTPFKRAVENNYIDPHRSIHVGVHGSTNNEDDFVQDKNMGFTVISGKEIFKNGPYNAIDKIKTIVGTNPCYVSIDIDVVDPAFAPGTGTPEVGGMSSITLITLIQELKGMNIIGGDVVEVSPAYDNNDITGLLAAKVCYELISLIK